MELRQLRQFVALCDAGNFHRAAEALHMAQPPLSISIRKLEDELGCKLFVRHSKGVTPTPAGELALHEARKALDHAEQVRTVAQAVANGTRGTLRIGFVGSATHALLPRLLPRFRKEFPQVHLALEESTTVAILARLDERTLDVGLVRYPLLQDPRRTIKVLEASPFMVAVPASSAWAARKRIALSALKDELFIAHSAAKVPNLHAIFMLLCQEAGFTPTIALEAVQVQTLVSLVESGLGIALVPASAARFANDAVRFIALTDQGGRIDTGIALIGQEDTHGALVRQFLRVASGSVVRSKARAS